MALKKTAQIPVINELFQIGLNENPSMVTLDHSIYKEISQEIIRWNQQLVAVFEHLVLD